MGRSGYKSMINMKLYHVLLAAMTLLPLASCHNHDEEDTNAPVLTLNEPAEGASISGQVHIEGKVTDESLHEMEITVTKDSDGSQYLHVTPEVHDETDYSFDEHFTPSGLTGETPVTLVITVSDHSDHTTTKTVKFKVKP